VLLSMRRLSGRAAEITVVDKSGGTLGAERITIFVCVDGEIWQGITANGVQDAVGILRDYLDVAGEKHPVAGPRLVTVAQPMPAVMCFRVLPDGDNAE